MSANEELVDNLTAQRDILEMKLRFVKDKLENTEAGLEAMLIEFGDNHTACDLCGDEKIDKERCCDEASFGEQWECAEITDFIFNEHTGVVEI